MKAVRVVVVDDSAVCRDLLRELLEADGDIQVVGEAESGETALPAIERLRPDLATIDIQMPGAGGLATIARIMAEAPVPLLVVTGQPKHTEAELAFAAVQRGALDLALKPDVQDKALAGRLRAKVRELARVPVVRHVAAHRAPSSEPEPARPRAAHTTPKCRVIGIGASAGGPAACAAVLSNLEARFAGAVVVVQHLPKGFAHSFAHFLAGASALEVEVARAGAVLRPRAVYVAPDDQHVVLTADGRLSTSSAAPVRGHRPSVNTFFESLAKAYGSMAAGVVLSGIGDDGSAGLLALRRAGALTLAQDEASSAVYGMPKAAFEAEAAQLVLPPDAIGRTLSAFGAAPAQASAR